MSQTPYSVTNDQQVPPQDNTLKIVLIVLGVVLLVVMLICGGIMAAGYFAVQRVATEFGEQFEDVFSGGFAREYLKAPEAQEALGQVVDTSIVMDMDDAEDDENANLEIRVTGTKGSGTLIIGTDDEGNELVQLVMDDGRIIDLPTPDFEDMEFEGVDEELEELPIEDVPMDVSPAGN